MFFGRTQELGEINRLYNTDRFEMLIMYGRRRVGKTTLIKEFCKDKNTVLFSAVESTEQENLKLFSNAVNKTSRAVFPDFQSLFSELAERGKSERLIVVIDEYPYLVKAVRGISSKLQHAIDHDFLDTKLFVILCGSSISFMESHVLGSKSPLFGRRTAQLKVQPFDYLDTAKCFPNLSSEEKALAYGITGGIPLYIQRMLLYPTIQEGVLREIFNPVGYLYEEPANLLRQELREPQVYNSVVTAIANGYTRVSEIATQIGSDTANASKYLYSLEALGIVHKETPVGERLGKKSIYMISDLFFRFWYRFVPQIHNSIIAGYVEDVLEKMVYSNMNQYMGLIFERMCREYLLHNIKDLPIIPTDVGQWWGTDKKRRCQVQIDIVMSNYDSSEMILGECKYINTLVDVEVLDNLMEHSKLFPKLKQAHYVIFSKIGFTDKLLERAVIEHVKLITLDEMMPKDM